MGTFSKLGSVRTAVTRSGCLLVRDGIHTSSRHERRAWSRRVALPSPPCLSGPGEGPRPHPEDTASGRTAPPARASAVSQGAEGTGTRTRRFRNAGAAPRRLAHVAPRSRLQAPCPRRDAAREAGARHTESRLGRRAPVTARGGGIAHPAVRTLALVSVI